MAKGPMQLSQNNIYAGENRAFRLFRDKVDANGGGYISAKDVKGFSGPGSEMVRDVYGVARHIEGSKLSKSLGKKGVNSVSLTSIRSALTQLGDGLVTRAFNTGDKNGVLNGTKAELGRASDAGSTLARFIQATK